MSYPKLLSLDRLNSRRQPSSSASKQGNAPDGLEVFVCGEENAMIADLFVANRLREIATWSPLYLYGPHLVGKTCLANSIAARYCRTDAALTSIYSEGGDFARGLAAAIDSDDMERFRTRHRASSIFILDGIQDLATKQSAQEELIATLDHREREQLPTILIGLTLPHSLRGLKPHLVSRCLGGLSIEIHFPGTETRIKLLQLLAKKLDMRLTEEEITRFMTRLTTSISVPELQGLLLKWLHQERLAAAENRQRQGTEMLDELLDERHQSLIPDVASIAKRVAKEFNVRLSDLRSATRKSNIVRARSLAMLMARQLTPLSFQQIGEYFGGRDHTTVMHACRKLESDLSKDRELQRIADEVKRLL